MDVLDNYNRLTRQAELSTTDPFVSIPSTLYLSAWLNTNITAAHVPRPMSTPYTMSKHAIAGLTKCTALDGRSFNITATQLNIGRCASMPGPFACLT